MENLQATRIDDVPGGSLASRPGERSVVAVGNFDGVHRGHRSVVTAARAEAGGEGLTLRVLTFDPHPAVVLGRTPPPTLTTLPRKAELLRRVGVDEVCVKRFDLAFSLWSPERFVEELLARALGARVVVVGDNFRFGHKRAGDFAALTRLGEKLGFTAHSFPVQGDARGPFSSTRVRDAVARGDLADASEVLGRPHAVSGVVVRGDQRGRTIGFPTANLVEVPEVLPPNGVYAVLVDALDGTGGAAALGHGVMNIGVRPTVDHTGVRTLEVHLFDFDGDLYGRALRVHLVARLREERKFAGLAELQAQIARDVEEARAITRDFGPGQGAFG